MIVTKDRERASKRASGWRAFERSGRASERYGRALAWREPEMEQGGPQSILWRR